MIIVTGLRSGTSLMMQTLKILGVPITGTAYHKEFSHKDLNPKGYWTLPMSETLGGITDHRYKGMAVKLGGGDLSTTNPDFVDKVIWCKRNKDSCVQSIMKLMEVDFDIIGIDPSEKNAETVYTLNEFFTIAFKTKEKKEFLDIMYEDFYKRPEKTVNSIAQFIGTDCQIEKCIENIIKEPVCQ